MNKTIRYQNTMTMTSRIRNFRPASGFIIALDTETDDKSFAVSSSAAARLLSTVYRCGSTDVLGEEEETNDTPRALSSSFADDQIVYQHAGLIIDLRSPAERNDVDAERWMNHCSAVGSARRRRPIHVFTIPIDNDDEEDYSSSSSMIISELHEKIFDDDDHSRYVIRLDILNRQELLRYIQNKWLKKKNSASSLLLLAPDEESNNDLASSEIITKELNKRGLAGLNEAILETKSGQIGLCRALQIMTSYREAVAIMKKKKNRNNIDSTTDDDDTSIVIHCVLGKDR
jgi:hypothetical protein